MRSMRVVVAALVLVAAPMAAQDPAPQPQGRQGMGQNSQRQNEILFKDITLTDAQKKSVDSIQAASREAQRTLMQSGGMQDPATRQQMMDLRTKAMTDIRAVLTPEQQATFDKNRETLASQMPAGRRPPR